MEERDHPEDIPATGEPSHVAGPARGVPSPRVIFAPLAASLAQQIWRPEALATHLGQRLPRGLAGSIPGLVRHLLQAFPGSVAPDAARILAELSATTAGPRILEHAKRTATRPAVWITSAAFQPPDHAPHLPALATPAELADWLGITPDQLIRFADLRGLSALHGDHFGQHYIAHLVPKRDGSLRLIEEPKPFLKTLQRRLLAGLLQTAPAHPCAWGFVRGRNCAMAAAHHAGEQMVVSFDLADFFPGIGFARVYAIFRSLGFPASVARDLAGLTTALTRSGVLASPGLVARDRLRSRHLPQGAPSSPALANLAAFRLDQRLAGLAHSIGAVYSRYADDLTFSGDRHIADILVRAVPEIVVEEGFAVNPAKTRQSAAHQRQLVTGLVVNQKINTPRAEYDRLKAVLHHLARPGDRRRYDPAFMARLQGQINWVASVNPARGARLFGTLERLPQPQV